MFNAEKLLGSLLNGGMSSRFDLPVGPLGLGTLGVAFAAAEQFFNKDEQPRPAAYEGARQAPPPPGAHPGTPPPPPPPTISPSQTPPTPPLPSAPGAQQNAILLIRAMIASANADGVIDAEEFLRIMERLEKIGLSMEERDFLKAEMKNPYSVEEIAAQALDAGLAQEAYTASLLAVTVDTRAEEDYLETLRTLLRIAPDQAAQMRAELLRRTE